MLSIRRRLLIFSFLFASSFLAKAEAACLGDEIGTLGPTRQVFSLDQRLSIYQSLGIKWQRVGTRVPIVHHPSVADIDDIPAYEQAGYKIFLTIVNPKLTSGGSDPGDLNSYSAELSKIVQQYRPAIVAAENEADNPPYKMSASAYLEDLKATCAVAHANGALCTDSGMTSKMAIAIMVDDYLSQGNTAAAMNASKYLATWYGPLKFADNSSLKAFLQSKDVERNEDVLRGLRAAGIDGVDLHWYIRSNLSAADQQNLLTAVAQTFVQLSGLPIIGGEIGIDTPKIDDRVLPPEMLLNEIQTLASLNVNPIILWNPGRGLFTANTGAKSLVDERGNILRVGQALAQYIQKSCSR